MATKPANAQIHRPAVDRPALELLGRDLLLLLGEDPSRPGLLETPRRFADAWAEFIDFDAGRTDTTFASVKMDQMIVVSWIGVWSICEHHLLPFRVELAVGYICQERVLGLSKIPRLAQLVAHRLQLQERLVEQLADEIGRAAETPHVAVVGRGEHLCLSMRGVRAKATMTTSVMRGAFLDREAARLEFLRLVEGSHA